jgi:threonine dehydratase
LALTAADPSSGRCDRPWLPELTAVHGRRTLCRAGPEILVKVETLNPIGSFKGRGTGLLARKLDPALTSVCATAGNFGQGLAYAARARGAHVHVFAALGAPVAKVERMRALGASVEVSDSSESAPREYAEAGLDIGPPEQDEPPDRSPSCRTPRWSSL